MPNLFAESSAHIYKILLILPIFFSIIAASWAARRSSSSIWRILFWGVLFVFFSISAIFLYKTEVWLAMGPIIPAALILGLLFKCKKQGGNIL